MSDLRFRKMRPAPSRWMVSCAVMLALLMLFAHAPAASAQTTLDVDNSGACSDVDGAPYCHIQAAINAAAPGDTINVAPGTYAEILAITTDDISLIGADEATVIIDATAATGYHFTVNASSVTLKNFTLNGNNSNVASYGLKISGLNTSTKRTNIVLENVTVNNTYRSGIDVNGIDGVTVTNVTIRNVPYGVGLALSDVDNAVVNGVTTSGNAWGGTAIYTWGRYYPGGSNNVTLSNIHGEEVVALYVEVGNYNDLSNPYPVTNLTVPPEYLYMVTNPDHRPNGANFSFYMTSLTDALAFAEELNNATTPTNAGSSVVPLNPDPQIAWHQDFSIDDNGWFDDDDDWYGDIVVSGGTAMFYGGGGSSPFSRFDGYRNAWRGTWVAEIDVYLDPAWPTGQGFDYSVAATRSNGSHLRDFIFHVGIVEDYGSVVGKALLVNASNNADFQTNPFKLVNDNGGNYFTVGTAGWYTLQHVFRDAGGYLAVDLNLIDSTGSILWTATRENPTDTIPGEVGGNRYAWFTHIDVASGIPVDNHKLTCPSGQCWPNIYVTDETVNVTGASSLSVPVMLNANNAVLSSAAFTLDYDGACLTLDTVTDSNNDGIPDSMTGLPANHELTFDHDITNTQIEILVKSPEVDPLEVLNSGSLVLFNFGLLPACVPTSPAITEVDFGLSGQSFGNTAGQSVDGTNRDGTYMLTANAFPTEVTLTPAEVNEEQPAGTLIGTLETVDPDAGDTHTYALVETCVGTIENFAFEVSGDQLLTRGRLDHEAKDSYTICVETTDNQGGAFAKPLTVTVNDVNEAPDSISLSNNSVVDNALAGTVVGTLSATDPDDGTTLTFSLPNGALNNASFAIDGDGITLKTVDAFDYETKNSYNIKVQVADNGAPPLTFEQVFTIVVTNQNDAPVANNDPSVTPLVLLSGSTTNIDVLANDTDADGDALTVNSVDATSTAGGSVTDNDADVSYTAPNNYNGVDSFTYTAIDDGTPTLVSNAATVAVQVVTDDDRGDCNMDGVIDAADFPATVLEIFDTDITIDWWNTHTGSFMGSPKGCDSNGSENGLTGLLPSVDAADITCTVLVFFGDTSCTLGGVQAASADTVTIGLGALGGDGLVAVPVEMSGAGSDIAAATFTLTYDAAAYSFNDADADGDGLPDAVAISAPAGMAKMVFHDAPAHRVQVALFGTSLPLPTLSNGALAVVTLEPVSAGADATALTLADVSLGNTAGQSVAVVVDGRDDGERLPGEEGTSVFLPLVSKQ